MIRSLLQYVRQLAREAVATQLGISERQLRREQRVAIEVLAQQLWPQLMESSRAANAGPTSRQTDAAQMSACADQALSAELLWLKKRRRQSADAAWRRPWKMCAAWRSPLAQQWHVPLQIDLTADLVDLPVPPLALRSILLTVLSVAIPRPGRHRSS